MQFYKFKGYMVDDKQSEENYDRRVMREKARKIFMKSNAFNRRRLCKEYLFVTNVCDDVVEIGIIVRNSCDVYGLVSEYLKAVGLELKDTGLEEITFLSLRNMLGYANRYDFMRKKGRFFFPLFKRHLRMPLFMCKKLHIEHGILVMEGGIST